MPRLVLIFLVLIAYGSLYPFDVWAPPHAPLFQFLTAWPTVLDHADLVQNVLAYAPFGLFLCLCFLGAGKAGTRMAVLGTAGGGLVLSTLMESLQQFEPARVASTADIAMNVAGTLAGAVLALVFGRPVAASALAQRHRLHPLRSIHDAQRWRARRFKSGTLPNIGLAALALWALSETSPLVPALDLRYLARNLVNLAWELGHPLETGLASVLVAACLLTGLGLLLRSVLRGGGDGSSPLAHARGPLAGQLRASVPRAPEALMFVGMLALVFGAKLMVYGRMLGMADVLGGALALGVLHLTRAAPAAAVARAGGAALLCGFVLGEVLPAGSASYWDFNWMPLAGQLRSLSGMENILELFWPFFALAYFVRTGTPAVRRMQLMFLGGALVLALVFWLEWHQQEVAGRYGDITQVLLALGGWLLPWSFRSDDYQAAAPFTASRGPVATTGPRQAHAVADCGQDGSRANC